jgi:hypothetical protein
MNSFTLWASRWSHDPDDIVWKSPGGTFVWNAQTGYFTVDGLIAGMIYGLSLTQETCWEILQNKLKTLPLS